MRGGCACERLNHYDLITVDEILEGEVRRREDVRCLEGLIVGRAGGVGSIAPAFASIRERLGHPLGRLGAGFWLI